MRSNDKRYTRNIDIEIASILGQCEGGQNFNIIYLIVFLFYYFLVR